MGTILHGGAKTTPKIRKEIQESKESLAVLAERYHLNFKTILKWRRRPDTNDGKSGPKKPRSSLSEREQAIVCEFRRMTQFSLDDILLALKDKIPTLTRSNLHRCLKRNGLSRPIPEESGEKTKRKKFKSYEIGFMHMDIAQIHTAEGKAYLFVAIDRKTRYVFAELHPRMNAATAATFLQNVIADVPFKIHRILTDNGAQFTYKLLVKHLVPANKTHPLDVVCEKHGIAHRLTEFRHPWTNGLVERMNRTIRISKEIS
jgi:hypothetical protein